MMGEAEQILSVSQAAWLSDMTAQTIRNWITSGKLPAEMTRVPGKPASYAIRLEDLVAIPGLLLDPERLGALQRPQIAERLDKRLLELEQQQAETAAEVDELKRQFAALLELVSAPTALPQPKIAHMLAAIAPAAAALEDYLPARYPNQQMRSNFLANHGWSRTVTGGEEWKTQCPWGPPEAVLRWALEREERIGWRGQVRGRTIHECAVPDCPCHQLFASLSRAADADA